MDSGYGTTTTGGGPSKKVALWTLEWQLRGNVIIRKAQRAIQAGDCRPPAAEVLIKVSPAQAQARSSGYPPGTLSSVHGLGVFNWINQFQVLFKASAVALVQFAASVLYPKTRDVLRLNTRSVHRLGLSVAEKVGCLEEVLLQFFRKCLYSTSRYIEIPDIF